jgi:hypothetical protein
MNGITVKGLQAPLSPWCSTAMTFVIDQDFDIAVSQYQTTAIRAREQTISEYRNTGIL